MNKSVLSKIAFIMILTTLISFSTSAKVMNENKNTLPPGCSQISGWKNLTIHGGKDFAKQFPSKVFTYDNRTLQFEPCTKLTVTFVNNDSIRHQWMVHGLPKSIYPMGMFNIEVTGPGRDTGTFILPSGDETLLIHCGVGQHTQKGMKAQIKVGKGDGKVANIPGFTDPFNEYKYERKDSLSLSLIAVVIGAGLGFAIIPMYNRFKRKRREE